MESRAPLPAVFSVARRAKVAGHLVSAVLRSRIQTESDQERERSETDGSNSTLTDWETVSSSSASVALSASRGGGSANLSKRRRRLRPLLDPFSELRDALALGRGRFPLLNDYRLKGGGIRLGGAS